MIDPRDVLAATLATEFAPASNLKGRVAGATWRYLLPSLERSRILVAGPAEAATLETLAASGAEIAVMPGEVARGGLRRPWRRAGPASPLPALETVGVADVERWLRERPTGSLDLVLVTDRGAPIDGTEPAVRRLLAPDGVVVREGTARRGPANDPADPAAGPARRAAVAVRPDRGEIRSAVGAGDERSARLLAVRGLAGPALRRPGPRRVVAVAARILGDRPRTLELDLPTGAATLPDAPSWLAAIADAAGVDIGGMRCALSAIGDYNTQKVLLLLRRPDADEPEVVVKLTRHPSVNRRLETERDALRRLETFGTLAEGRVPRVLFAGHHAGLAVVAESALAGGPFGQLPGPAQEAAAGNALDWLSLLAEGSARTAPAASVAEALAGLHAGYVALCRPTAAEAARLAAAVDTIARSGDPFPVVFQHGDPGTWNLLVDDAGRVAFLDWENADAAGMPLWDLLYLLRSHAVGSARRAGVRRRLVAVERYLFGASPLSDTIVASVGSYAARLGMDRRLVEPLFHLCWMHQALKEATRTDPGRVRDGHYNRLLRLGLERRTAPTLGRLFAGSER